MVLIREPIKFYVSKGMNYVKFFAKPPTAENVSWWKFRGFPQYLLAPKQRSHHFELHEVFQHVEGHRQPLVPENTEPIGKLLKR